MCKALLEIAKEWIPAQAELNLKSPTPTFFLKTHSAQLTYFDNYFTDIKHTLGFIYIIK